MEFFLKKIICILPDSVLPTFFGKLLRAWNSATNQIQNTWQFPRHGSTATLWIRSAKGSILCFVFLSFPALGNWHRWSNTQTHRETRFAFTLGILCVLRVLPLFALSSLEGGEGDKHLCDPPSGAIIFRWERSGREKLSLLLSWVSRSEGHRNRDCSNRVHARRRRKRAQKKEAPFRQRRAAYRKTLLFLLCALCRKKRGGGGTQNACLLSLSLSLPVLLSVAAVMKREDGRRRGKKCDSPFHLFFLF